jgi:putative tricarboxylic transport membrane protein
MDEILQAFSTLGDPVYWGVVIGAAIASALTGLIPGASGIVVMSLMIPFLLQNVSDPAIGLVALATVTGVNNGLDTIPAILLGQPGGGNNVSFLEGHQLARQGKAAHTLGAVYAASMLGGVVGALTLAAVIPIMKPFVLSFSFAEIGMLALFGVAMVSGLSKGAMRKGLAAGLLGLMLGSVGIAPGTGDERFVFQRPELWGGLPLIAATLGLFALPEMVDLTLTGQSVAPKGSEVSTRQVVAGAKEGFRSWPVIIRQSIFGVFLGAIPGVGQATIDWLSYVFGIFFTKDKSQFGKGSLLGVIFAESAQNAKESGQAIPTLALGVPGGLSWALILVAMLAYNISPGPTLLGDRADILILMVITLSIGNLLLMVLGIGFTGQLAKLTLVPYPMVGAIIIPIVFLTGLIESTSWLSLPIMFVFMGIGLIMKQYQWPRPPMLLGIILGEVIERNLTTAINLHGWTSSGGVLVRPLTVALFIIVVATMVFFSRSAAKQAAEDAKAYASEEVVTLSFKKALISWYNMPILLAIGGSLAFIVSSMGFRFEARIFPMGAGIGIIILSLSQLYTHLTKRSYRKADIMDIGMKSSGMEGLRTNIYKVATMLGTFVVVTGFIGMQWATVAYAILSPVLFMQGKWRYLGPVISVAIVGIFQIYLMDRFLAVIWPQAAVWHFITTRIF